MIVCWGKIRDLASPFGILIPSSVFLTVPALVLPCCSPFSDRSLEIEREFEWVRTKRLRKCQNEFLASPFDDFLKSVSWKWKWRVMRVRGVTLSLKPSPMWFGMGWTLYYKFPNLTFSFFLSILSVSKILSFQLDFFLQICSFFRMTY